MLGQHKVMFTSPFSSINLPLFPSLKPFLAVSQTSFPIKAVLSTISLSLKRLSFKGSGITPILLNLYLSAIPTSLSRSSPCYFLLYADDLVMFASKHSLITASSYISLTLPISSTFPTQKVSQSLSLICPTRHVALLSTGHR